MYFPQPNASKGVVRDKNVMYCTYHCSLCKELCSVTASISTFRVLDTQNIARFMHLQANDTSYAFIPSIHEQINADGAGKQLLIWDGIRWLIIMFLRNRRETVTYKVEPTWSPCHISVISILILSRIRRGVVLPLNFLINPLKPNDPCRGRTAPLTSKSCIIYIYSTNIGTEYFKHGIYSPFCHLQNAVCFIILTYLVHVLFTFYIQGVLKLKKNFGAKRLTSEWLFCQDQGQFVTKLWTRRPGNRGSTPGRGAGSSPLHRTQSHYKAT